MKPRLLLATAAVPGAEQLRRHCQIKSFWFVNTRFAGRGIADNVRNLPFLTRTDTRPKGNSAGAGFYSDNTQWRHIGQ